MLKDTRLLPDTGLSAYRAAQRRDSRTLVDLNADLRGRPGVSRQLPAWVPTAAVGSNAGLRARLYES